MHIIKDETEKLREYYQEKSLGALHALPMQTSCVPRSHLQGGSVAHHLEDPCLRPDAVKPSRILGDLTSCSAPRPKETAPRQCEKQSRTSPSSDSAPLWPFAYMPPCADCRLVPL